MRHVRLKRDETETARTCVVLYYHPNEAPTYADAAIGDLVECFSSIISLRFARVFRLSRLRPARTVPERTLPSARCMMSHDRSLVLPLPGTRAP